MVYFVLFWDLGCGGVEIGLPICLEERFNIYYVLSPPVQLFMLLKLVDCENLNPNFLGAIAFVSL